MVCGCASEYLRRARCGNSARRDLCGGGRVTGRPTVIPKYEKIETTMRRAIRMLTIGAISVSGCGEPTEAPLPLVVQGDSASVERVEHALKQLPRLHVPESGVAYSISVVKPDSSIDYKIVQVYPDTTVDYKILVVDPRSGSNLAPLSKRLDDAIRIIPRERTK